MLDWINETAPASHGLFYVNDDAIDGKDNHGQAHPDRCRSGLHVWYVEARGRFHHPRQLPASAVWRPPAAPLSPDR